MGYVSGDLIETDFRSVRARDLLRAAAVGGCSRKSTAIYAHERSEIYAMQTYDWTAVAAAGVCVRNTAEKTVTHPAPPDDCQLPHHTDDG